MPPAQSYQHLPQSPPQRLRNDCADCYVGRPHMHDGSSSDDGAVDWIMYGSDPAHAYPCGAATGVGHVGARENEGTVFLVDTAWHIIMRTTRFGITTFTNTGLLSSAQPGNQSLSLSELLTARLPLTQGPVPSTAMPEGGQDDPRNNAGTSTAPQPDSRRARGLAPAAPAWTLPTDPPPGGPRS